MSDWPKRQSLKTELTSASETRYFIFPTPPSPPPHRDFWNYKARRVDRQSLWTRGTIFRGHDRDLLSLTHGHQAADHTLPLQHPAKKKETAAINNLGGGREYLGMCVCGSVNLKVWKVLKTVWTSYFGYWKKTDRMKLLCTLGSFPFRAIIEEPAVKFYLRQMEKSTSTFRIVAEKLKQKGMQLLAEWRVGRFSSKLGRSRRDSPGLRLLNVFFSKESAGFINSPLLHPLPPFFIPEQVRAWFFLSTFK